MTTFWSTYKPATGFGWNPHKSSHEQFVRCLRTMKSIRKKSQEYLVHTWNPWRETGKHRINNIRDYSDCQVSFKSSSFSMWTLTPLLIQLLFSTDTVNTNENIEPASADQNVQFGTNYYGMILKKANKYRVIQTYGQRCLGRSDQTNLRKCFYPTSSYYTWAIPEWILDLTLQVQSGATGLDDIEHEACQAERFKSNMLNLPS